MIEEANPMKVITKPVEMLAWYESDGTL